MRLLLTGATGLLGRSFAQIALNSGCKLTALVRPGSQTEHLRKMGIQLAPGDLHDQQSLGDAMAGCDAVVHAASPHGGWRPPALYQLDVIQATQNILFAMKENQIRKLAYVSTISVHGLDPVLGKIVNEESGYGHTYLPYDDYSRSKAAAEILVHESHKRGFITANVLRLGWLYGPHDRRSYGLLARRVKRRLAFRIGTGNNLIPLVYVDNAAWALWRCLETETQNNVYLYASDGHISQNEYLDSLLRAAQVSYPIPTIPKNFLLALAGLNENLGKWSGYRLPVLTTRYFIHLFGSNWQFNDQQSHQKLSCKSTIGYSEGLKRAEHWYQQAQTRELYE
jgi:nucleoside-diphosphate-sugar epimerase